MENDGSRGSSTPMIVGIVGGIALAIGSFLNWATVSVNFDKIATALGIDPAQIPAGVRAQGTVSVTGWKSGDGKWTLVAGVVVAVAAVLLTMASSRQVVGIVMLVGGAVGGGLALYDATIQKNDAIDNAAAQFTNIGLPGTIRDYFSVSLGIGIWLCIAGGAVAIVAGIMAMASRAPSVEAAGVDPMVTTPPPSPASDAGFGTTGVGGSLMPPAAVTPAGRRASGRRAPDADPGRRASGPGCQAPGCRAPGRRVPRHCRTRRRHRESPPPRTTHPARPDVRSIELEIDTSGRRVVDVTERVRAFAADAGSAGLLHVFVPHATAGVALMETGSGSESDLDELLGRLLPRDDRYTHRHGSVGHGGDHLLPVLVSPSLTLPVLDGGIALGTWQSVVLVDPNRENNTRRLRLSFVPA